jgi:hypothetical protein
MSVIGVVRCSSDLSGSGLSVLNSLVDGRIESDVYKLTIPVVDLLHHHVS